MITYSQLIKASTWAELLTTTAGLGDIGFAIDAMQYAHHNGTTWVPGQSIGSTSVLKPTITAGSGAGSGSSISIRGNNTTGFITFVQGTGGLANNQILTFTLAKSVTYPNGMTILFTAANDNFTTISGSIYCPEVTGGNVTTMSLMLKGVAPTAGLTFVGEYEVYGY